MQLMHTVTFEKTVFDGNEWFLEADPDDFCCLVKSVSDGSDFEPEVTVKLVERELRYKLSINRDKEKFIAVKGGRSSWGVWRTKFRQLEFETLMPTLASIPKASIYWFVVPCCL